MQITLTPKTKKILGIITIVILGVVVLWGGWAYIINHDRTATILETSGTVLYNPVGGSQWATAKPGMKIHEGDQLLTQSPEGRLIAVVDDGNFGFQLIPDTLVTYTARWNTLLEHGSGGVYLSYGTVIAETRDDASPRKTSFEVDTEVTQVVLEGSRTIVQKLKNEATTRVSALKGEIWVGSKTVGTQLLWDDGEKLNDKEVTLHDDDTVIVYLMQTEREPDFEANLGEVIDSKTGLGVPGILVQAVGKPEVFAITDKDGFFDIPGESAFEELVLAGKTQESADTLVLMPYTSRLDQKVMNAFELNGVPRAKIIPIDHPELAVDTNMDGTFSIKGLPVGSHSLSVVAEGYISQVVEATVTPQGQTSISDIMLIPSNGIEAFLPVVLNEFPQYP